MVSVPFGTTEEYGNKALVCDRSVTFARLLTNLEHFSVNDRTNVFQLRLCQVGST